MPSVVRPETVRPPVAHIDQLKHEVYTLGTSFRRVSSESGLSTDTIKSILNGNDCEQSTAARLEAYLKALSRNEFSAVRNLKRFERGTLSGQNKALERRAYAVNTELWREYGLKSINFEKFMRLNRRQRIIRANIEERTAKLALMQKYRAFIDTHRVWLADGWSYWRWKYYLMYRMKTSLRK